MALPDAPLEGQGDKILFVVYDATGTNTAAVMRAIGQTTLNGENVAHLGVASHIEGDTLSGTDPIIVVAGADGGGDVYPLLVDATGNLQVDIVNAPTVDTELPTAAALGDAVSNPTTPVVGSAQMVFDGTNWQRERKPNVFKSFSGTTITSETTIWTPAGGKKFRLMGFVITQTTATGDITVRDDTAGSTILTIPAHTLGEVQSVDLGIGILSATADNVLTMQGASTEAISGFVYGTEE